MGTLKTLKEFTVVKVDIPKGMEAKTEPKKTSKTPEHQLPKHNVKEGVDESLKGFALGVAGAAGKAFGKIAPKTTQAMVDKAREEEERKKKEYDADTEHMLKMARAGMAKARGEKVSEDVNENATHMIHTKKPSGELGPKIKVRALDDKNAEFQANRMVGQKPYRGYEVHKIERLKEDTVDEAFVMVPHHVVKSVSSSVLDAHNKATGQSIEHSHLHADPSKPEHRALINRIGQHVSKKIGKNVRAIPGSHEMKFAEGKEEDMADSKLEEAVGRIHKGTYGTSHVEVDDEDEHISKPAHTEPKASKGHSSDALAAALGLTPKKGPDEKRMKQIAAGYGPKGVRVIRHQMKEGIEYSVLKEGMTYRFVIMNEENEIVAEGRAPTENGVCVLADRLIEATIDKVKGKDAMKSKAVELAKKAVKKHY